MFADDIVFCSETSEDVELQFDRWCTDLKIGRMKANRTKTDYRDLNGHRNDKTELEVLRFQK